MSFSHTENKEKGEIASIGLMRGIASSMVCIFHLSNGNRRLLPDTNILRTTAWWFHSGVEIFFIISGFIIPYSMYVKNYSINNIGIFLKKRIIRIEPPYIISIVLVLVSGFASSLMPFYRGSPYHVDWLNVAGHIAYLNIFTGNKWLQDVYWTLAIEFQYYILIAVVYFLVVSRTLYLRALFFILFMALISLRSLLPFSICGFVPFFMMGILLFQYYCRISTAFEFGILLLLTALSSYYTEESVVVTLISLATVFIIANIKKIHPAFAFLGTVSYSLYLVHIPLGGKFINITEAFIQSVHVKEVMVFVVYSFCLLMAYLYYVLVEKRFKILSGKIRYKKAVTAPFAVETFNNL